MEVTTRNFKDRGEYEFADETGGRKVDNNEKTEAPQVDERMIGAVLNGIMRVMLNATKHGQCSWLPDDPEKIEAVTGWKPPKKKDERTRLVWYMPTFTEGHAILYASGKPELELFLNEFPDSSASITYEKAPKELKKLVKLAKKAAKDMSANMDIRALSAIIDLTVEGVFHWYGMKDGSYRVREFKSPIIAYYPDAKKVTINGTTDSSISEKDSADDSKTAGKPINSDSFKAQEFAGKRYNKLIKRLAKAIKAPGNVRLGQFVKRALLPVLTGIVILNAAHFMPYITNGVEQQKVYDIITDDVGEAGTFLPYKDWYGRKEATLVYGSKHETVRLSKGKDGYWYLKNIRVQGKINVKEAKLYNNVLTVPVSAYSDVTSRNMFYGMLTSYALYALVMLIYYTLRWNAREKAIKKWKKGADRQFKSLNRR